jgi:predicted ATPase
LEQLPQTPPQPVALANQIHGATGGNAFFVLETIRDLLENDLLVSPPADLPLPDTVQRRLDRLSPVARQVLEAAAVLSPDLRFELLQETAGRSAHELADGFDECSPTNCW